MAFIRAKPYASRPLPVRRLHVDDERSLAKIANGRPLTAGNLDLWVAQSSGGERQTLERIRRSLFDPAFQSDDRVLSKDGAAAVSKTTGLALQAHRAVEGEPAEVTEVRTRMPDGLWGQEHALDAFVKLREDGLSSTRRTSPLLVMAGDVAHGKDEAIQVFAELVGKPATEKEDAEPAELISVNLAGTTDKDVGVLFGEDGQLEAKVLEDKAKKGNVVIRLRNMPSGQPKLAAKFNELFNEESSISKSLFFVADFDGAVKPHDEFGQAFGAPGVRQISAEVEFGHLGADTMLRYADHVLPDLLKGTRLEDQTLVWDARARDVLSRALATEHEPLDDLKPRLQNFVLSHIHTQTSIDPKASVLRFEVAAPYEHDANALDALIDRLNQPLPRLSEGGRLFRATEVARKADLTEVEIGLLVDDTIGLTTALRDHPLFEGQRLDRLQRAVELALNQTQAAQSFGWFERITAPQFERFTEAVEEIEQALIEHAQSPEGQEQRAELEEVRQLLGSLDATMRQLAGNTDTENLAGSTLGAVLEPSGDAGNE